MESYTSMAPKVVMITGASRGKLKYKQISYYQAPEYSTRADFEFSQA